MNKAQIEQATQALLKLESFPGVSELSAEARTALFSAVVARLFSISTISDSKGEL